MGLRYGYLPNSLIRVSFPRTNEVDHDNLPSSPARTRSKFTALFEAGQTPDFVRKLALIYVCFSIILAEQDLSCKGSLIGRCYFHNLSLI